MCVFLAPPSLGRIFLFLLVFVRLDREKSRVSRESASCGILACFLVTHIYTQLLSPPLLLFFFSELLLQGSLLLGRCQLCRLLWFFIVLFPVILDLFFFIIKPSPASNRRRNRTSGSGRGRDLLGGLLIGGSVCRVERIKRGRVSGVFQRTAAIPSAQNSARGSS